MRFGKALKSQFFIKNKNAILQAVRLVLYFFTAWIVKSAAVKYISLNISEEFLTAIYIAGALFIILGYLLYFFIQKHQQTNNIVLIVIGFLAVASSIASALLQHNVLFVISLFILLFALGFTGGLCYCYFCISFCKSPFLGRIFGSSAAAGVLFGFLAENVLSGYAAYFICAAIAIAAIVFLSAKYLKNTVLENLSSGQKRSPRYVFLFISAVVVLIVICCIISSIMIGRNVIIEQGLLNCERLFYAVGLIIVGFTADISHRLYLPLIIVCASVFSVPISLLVGNDAWYSGVFAFFHIYTGMCITFSAISFIDFASETKKPALWAGMGNILSCLTTMALILTHSILHNVLSASLMVIISCAMTIILMVLFFCFYSRRYKKDDNTLSDLSHEAYCQKLFAQNCLFTPKETEVFKQLITTEDSIQELADKLYVSRRTFQRYVTSIYEKSDVKSRLGLYQKYTNTIRNF